MGVKLMELGVYMRKGVIFTIKGCCRSVWKHPFLVCVMCAFIHMSRSYPCMFSLLVSASPVLVCTAVLLGLLLLSGQQNTPETEKEKRARYEAIALKHGMLYDANNVNEQNERSCVERYSKSKRDEVEKVGVESGLLVSKLAEIRVGGSVDGGGGGGGGALSKERRSVGNESESSETWEATGELDAPTQQQKGEWSEERVGDGESMVDHYAIISKVIGELLESESEQEKSDEEDCSDSDSVSDSERGSVDSPPHASWKKQVQGDGDGDGGDDDDSDGAESSSPDASIDEMMPMLDELHPLLDEDSTAQPVQMSRVGSEAAPSSISSSSSIESGEETEVPGSEAADDDDDDEEESKKDQTKSVITWTEEDQKNLMDVGSSEIERNQRLERILRRRKNMSMVPEINLIDFENSEFQLNIAPISTARRNPFDLPHDAYDSNAPGSAPSIMLQRKNPFDLPFDDDEDESQEEHRPPSQSRQPFLRRRDNFLARPSIFAPKGEERQPARFRPFFIPDHTVSEESSYSSFQGQSSGVNSGHETESVSSVELLEEDHKVEERDVPHDQAVGSCVPSRDPVYDTSPGKNYSSSSSFSDAHSELDPGLTPRAPVADKRTQGEAPSSSSHSNHHDDQGQVPNAPVGSSEKTRSIHKLTIPEFHELDHDITTPCCAQVSIVKKGESTAPDHPQQGIVDSVEVEAEKKLDSSN